MSGSRSLFVLIKLRGDGLSDEQDDEEVQAAERVAGRR